MVFLLRKLAIGLLVASFFILIQAQAETVKPTFVRSAGTNMTIPIGVTLSADGTKIHFAKFNSGTNLYQYDLSIPFNVSSIDSSSEVILNVTGTDAMAGGKIEDLTFNGDGTKVYAIGFTGQMTVHSLPTPYDLSNATQDADDGINWSTDYGGEGGSNSSHRPHGMRFNNDGTKMFLVDAVNTKGVIEYNLSTPYLPGSASFGNFFATESSREIQDIDFDDDGTRMYVIESKSGNPSSDKIYAYKLSTGFDTSTATFAGSIANFFDAAGGDGGPGGMHFSKDGMKFYQVSFVNDSTGNINKVFEYDLSCPYGIVLCETETASVASAQIEIAKNVIHQNTSTIFKRFEWLRRNENKTNLNSHNLKLNINNPILASLKNKLQSSFKDLKYTQTSLKKEKPSNKKRNWSSWSHADISFGRVGDTFSLKPKEIKTAGIAIGADKLTKNNNIFGFAMRYGNDDVDIKSLSNEELNSQSLSFNTYMQIPVNEKSNLNALLGVSFLSIDQMISGTITGERNGKQIYTALSYEEEKNYTKFDIIPYGKTELGITQLSEYTDFGTSSTNNIENHEKLTFETGNASVGFKFDHTLYMDESRLSRNGFIEYIADFTSNIDHRYKSHSDNKTITNTIKKNSRDNIKGNIGFEFLKRSGHTFAVNYERFQSLDNSAHTDSLFFKFGGTQKNSPDFSVIYQPLKNNNTEISYLKDYNNFKLKFKSNYAVYSKIPDYGANLSLLSKF